MYNIVLFQGTTSMPVIGKDCKTIRKMIHKPYRHQNYSVENIDCYDGFHIIYNQENICVAMEIFSTDEINYNTFPLSGLTLEEVVYTMRKLHPDFTTVIWIGNKESIIYPEFSLCIAPNYETQRVEYVLVGEKGYYDTYSSMIISKQEKIVSDEEDVIEFTTSTIELDGEQGESVYDSDQLEQTATYEVMPQDDLPCGDTSVFIAYKKPVDNSEQK